eukprot:5221888-Amphidinium_carterae.2
MRLSSVIFVSSPSHQPSFALLLSNISLRMFCSNLSVSASLPRTMISSPWIHTFTPAPENRHGENRPCLTPARANDSP